MERGPMIRRGLALAVVLALGWHGVRLGMGKKVAESSAHAGGPVITVREMTVAPASMQSLLGMGDVMYRAEYYPRAGAEKAGVMVFKDDSLFAGEKLEVRWLPGGQAEVLLTGEPIFHWTGKVWRKPGF